MASTYVNDLRLNELATGDASGTWGTITNTNLELVAEAFSFGTEGITTNADTHTSTIADGATDPVRSMYVKYTGTLDSACTITIAPNTVSKLWFIENGTSGSQNIIISQGTGANVTIPAGDTKVLYSDGAGSGAAVVDAFASLSTVDLKVQDDLTVTDDASIGGDATVTGTLGVSGLLTANANITLAGTTPTLTIGDAGAEDTKIVFDGNAQDFYIALDDSADDLLVGLGSTVGTTPIISITEAGAVTLKNVGTGDDNPMSLTLQTSETDIAADDVLGKISFQAPDEGTGTDAILVAAAIQAISEGDFSASSNATSLAFMTGASEAAATKMTLTSAGKLGIGTVSPSVPLDIVTNLSSDTTTSPDTVLTIATKYASTGSNGGAGAGPRLEFKIPDDETNPITGAAIAGIKEVADDSDASAGMAFYISQNDTTLDEAMRIDHDGNVGIGVTSPTGKIHVAGSPPATNGGLVFVRNSDAASDNTSFGGIHFSSSPGTDFSIGKANVNGATTLSFRNGNTGASYMDINSSGQVFIGSTASVDAGFLVVKADASTYNHIVTQPTATASYNALAMVSGGGTRIGAISVGTSLNSITYGGTSDYRLKENIVPMEKGLERVKKLKPVKFDWKEDGSSSEGFIAHEIQEAGWEVGVEGQKDGEEMQMVEYGKLTPLLVKAIQEQQTQIEALQSEINTLKGE
jgi:hypothetical protein